MKRFLTLPFRFVWLILKVFGLAAKEAKTGLLGARHNQWYEISGYDFPVFFNLTGQVGGGIGAGMFGTFHFGSTGGQPLYGSITPGQWTLLLDADKLKRITDPAQQAA